MSSVDTDIARLPTIHPIEDWTTFIAVGKSSDYHGGMMGGLIMPEQTDDSMLMVGKVVRRGPDSKVPEEATHIHVRRGDLKNVMMISVTDNFAAARNDAIIGYECRGEILLLK